MRQCIFIWIVGWIGILGLTGWGMAQSTPLPDERRAHDVVIRLFEDGIYTIAEREAEDFLRRYPQSRWAAEVALIQARAAMQLGHYDRAMRVLRSMWDRAGDWADDYLYWSAQIQAAQGAYEEAAQEYHRLLTQYPQSNWRFEAAFREIEAWFRAGNYQQCIQSIQDPKGPFQKLAAEQPQNEWILRGRLLLAEAWLALGNLTAAEGALDVLGKLELPPGLDWQRRFLLMKIRYQTGRIIPALTESTNLWTVATNWVSLSLQAEAAYIQGRLFEQQKKPNQALQAYRRNFSMAIPVEWRKQTVERLMVLATQVELRSRVQQLLTEWIQNHPNDPIGDRIRFYLAQFPLEDYRALKRSAREVPSPEEDLQETLQKATHWLEELVRQNPQSSLLPEAWRLLGWCYSEAGRFSKAAQAFAEAVRRLPSGLKQAEARLKWADALLMENQAKAALTNYWLVATNYLQVEDYPKHFRETAFVQIIQAAIQAGVLNQAENALSHLHQAKVTSEQVQSVQLDLAEAWNRAGRPDRAQALIEDFRKRFPHSSFLPRADLILACSLERAGTYPQALEQYRRWLQTYTNLTGRLQSLMAQASFRMAALMLKQDTSTNAVSSMKTFLQRFPKDPNVSLGHYLLGEFYFRHGDFVAAEREFSHPSLRPKPDTQDPLPYYAQLMAARAAVARNRYEVAQGYLDMVITNGPLHRTHSPVPVDTAAEAYLLRGDLFLLASKAKNPDDLTPFGEALTAFLKVVEHLPNSRWVPVAWGRIGDCQFQLASKDPTRYPLAEAAYRHVIASEAPVELRSMAQVALGKVLEKEAALRTPQDQIPLLRQALEQYLAVVYGKNLRDGEQPDPYWVGRAGLAALDLAARLGDSNTLQGLIRRLEKELPVLRPRLEAMRRSLEASQKSKKNAG